MEGERSILGVVCKTCSEEIVDCHFEEFPNEDVRVIGIRDAAAGTYMVSTVEKFMEKIKELEIKSGNWKIFQKVC